MYEAYYQFQARPFQLSPDPRFFFSSRGHRRAMAYLTFGVHQGEGFIVITGEIGAGKTMLVTTLAHNLASRNLVLAQVVNTNLSADDMVRMVAAAFGLPQENNKAVLLNRVEQFLLTSHRQGKRMLLVVDEVQNLPARSVEELRMLSNYICAARPLLQIFLLCQPEFRKTLQRPLYQLHFLRARLQFAEWIAVIHPVGIPVRCPEFIVHGRHSTILTHHPNPGRMARLKRRVGYAQERFLSLRAQAIQA